LIVILLSEANEFIISDPVILGCIDTDPVYNSPPNEALNANSS